MGSQLQDVRRQDVQRDVLLWGARTKARIIEAMLEEAGDRRAAILFDPTLDAAEYASAAEFLNDPGALKARLGELRGFVVCIGGEHGYARLRTAEELKKTGLEPLSLAHARAFIDPTAQVGEGLQAMPGAVAHKFVRLGDQCVLNTNSVLDHECEVGSGVHVMGGAAVAGLVRIGDYATIGTNATVLPRLSIGEGAFVGAGAVVTKDVPAYTVVAGCPARSLRLITPRFDSAALSVLTA